MATKKYPRESLQFAMESPALSFAIVEGKSDAMQMNLAGAAYGGGVLNHAWFGRTVIDLASAKATLPMAIVYGHDTSNVSAVLGQATKVSIGNTVTIDEAKVFRVTQDAKDVIDLSAAGMVWGFSLGTMPGWMDEIPPGQKITVNGQLLEGPLMVVRNGDIYEGTVTPVPLDKSVHGQARLFSNDSTDQIEIEIRKGANDMSTKTVEQLQAELDKVNGEIAKRELDLKAATEAAGAKLEAAMAETQQLKNGIRETAIKSMFAATGMEFSIDAAKQYMSMTDEQFGAVAAHMTAARPKADPAFFKAAVVPGADPLAHQSQQGVPAEVIEARKIAADLVAHCTHSAVIKAAT